MVFLKKAKLVFVAVLTLLLTGCFVLPKRLPSWEADYQIPLTVAETTASEFLSDLESDGEKFFLNTSLEDTLDIGFLGVEVENQTELIEESFPVIDLGNLIDMDLAYQQEIVGNFEQSEVIKTVSFSEFVNLTVETGYVSLTVANVSGTSPVSLKLAVRFKNGQEIELPEFTNIAVGSSQTNEAPLDQRILTNEADLILKGFSLAIEGESATVNVGRLKMNISSVKSVKGHDFNVETSVKQFFNFTANDFNVQSCTLSSGQLRAEFQLPNGLRASIRKITVDGKELTETALNTFSLANIVLSEGSLVDISVSLSGDKAYEITRPEILGVSVSIQDLTLASVTMQSPKIELEEGFVLTLPELSLDEYLKEIRLDGASLSLLIKQEIGHIDYRDMKLNVLLKDSGATYDITVASVDSTADGDRLLFASLASKELVNDILGDRVLEVRLLGKLQGDGLITLAKDNKIDYIADVYVPFKLEGNQKIALSEQMQMVTLEDSARDLIKKAVGKVELVAEVNNGFPVGATVTLNLLGESGEKIAVLVGEVFPADTNLDGLAINTRKSVVSLELNQTQIRALMEKENFLLEPLLTIEVPESGAYFAPQNSINLRALLVVRAIINQ